MAEALAAALHLERCTNNTATLPAASSPRRPLGGYRIDPMPASFYRDGSASAGGLARVAARTLFVAADGGSDATGDGSMAKPFATLHHAQIQVRKVPVAARGPVTVEVRVRVPRPAVARLYRCIAAVYSPL